MGMHNRQVTISFKMYDTCPDISDELLAKAIHSFIVDYSDGRYPFDAEMLSEGLRRVYHHGMCIAIQELSKKELPTVNVTKHKDAGIEVQIPDWVKQADKKIKTLMTGVYDHEEFTTVEVESEK